MATRRRSRSLRSASHENGSVPLKAQFYRAATSPAAKALYVTVGSVGLAALAIAIFGPKRFNHQIVQPVRAVVGDQAEKLWSDARPLREQMGKLFDRAQSQAGREKLVRNFQSWIGHFKAT